MTSSAPFKRTHTSHLPELSLVNGAVTARFPKPQAGSSLLHELIFHDPSVFKDMPDDQNPLATPYHWHWYQQEYFLVKQGTFIFTLSNKTFTVTASTPSQPIKIPARAFHTFAVDPSSPSPAHIEIHATASPLSPSSALDTEYGLNERFFRNLYSYTDDCWKSGKAPSLVQMLCFLDSAEVSLAVPGCPRWAEGIVRVLTWGAGVVVGRWIGGLVGYRSSYGEYYIDGQELGKKSV